MATYTIELGKLLTLDGFDIGMKDYPLPSFLQSAGDRDNFRNALNQKILNHYQFNEICCLPPDRFKVFLNNTLNEQMPYFNLLYDALNEEWNFHTGGTITEVITRNGTSEGTATRTGSDELARSGIDSTNNTTQNTTSGTDYTVAVNSATPAALLNIESAISSNTYADNAAKNDNKTSSQSHGNSTDSTTYNSKETTTHNTTDKNNGKHNDNENRKVEGLPGKSYASLFKEYSESIRNLDLEVINCVKDCFMGIL